MLGADGKPKDLNGDGKITSGRELFGNHTLLQKGSNAGQEAANGFEALKELDDNGDGVADNVDAFPLDPLMSVMPNDPLDVTPPVITLISPWYAVEQ